MLCSIQVDIKMLICGHQPIKIILGTTIKVLRPTCIWFNHAQYPFLSINESNKVYISCACAMQKKHGWISHQTLLYTSSISSNLREIPTRSFHTLGARWRSRGFFVLMATPNSTPRNLNIAKSSSPEHAGFNRNLNIHSVSKWFSITVQGLLWTCVH